jgi:hypothetical protein
MSDDKAIVPVERIERLIYLIRGQKVMLDSALAEIYGVTTKRLNEQVGRNADRFPIDCCVSAYAAGSYGFEVANCDLKFGKLERTYRDPRVEISEL